MLACAPAMVAWRQGLRKSPTAESDNWGSTRQAPGPRHSRVGRCHIERTYLRAWAEAVEMAMSEERRSSQNCDQKPWMVVQPSPSVIRRRKREKSRESRWTG